MIRRTLALALALALLLPAAALAAGQVGEPAADFSLTDTQGITHVLSDHLGEVIYLFPVGHG